MSSQAAGHAHCPACKTEEVQADIHGFDGICRRCGFVIHDRSVPCPPDWQATTETVDEEENNEWLSYCRIHDSTEEQFALAFESLEGLASELGARSPLREEAAELYCEAFCSGTTNGRGTDCLVAVCLSLAAQQAAQPIPRGRLLTAESIEQKTFNLSHKAVVQNLGIDLGPIRPVLYVPFLQSDLSLLESEVTSTIHLIESLSGEPELSGKNPIGITSAAVYLTSKTGKTQKEVADAGGVSTETIRQRVVDLRRLCDLD